MKLTRPAVAISVGLSLVLASQAGAAAKKPPPCNAIVDVAGDGAPTVKALFEDLVTTAPSALPNAAVGPNNDALDIVSGDIASDKKNITAVIRVKKLSATSPTSAPSGMSWAFHFTADEQNFTFSAGSEPSGVVTYYASYYNATTKSGSLYGGGATGSFDTTKNEIHISAPVALLAAQATIKQGAKITNLDIGTGGQLRGPDPTKKVSSGGTIVTFSFPTFDTAATSKTYLGSGVNCVTPGK